MIHSLDLEMQVLSGLMSNPDAYPEVATIIEANDFYSEVNECIFKLIRNMYNNREEFDRVILGARLTQLSLGFRDDINPIDYIENLSMNRVAPKILMQSIAELKKVSLRRSCADMGKNMIKIMKDSSNWSAEEIRTYVDKTTYNVLDNWGSENDIINLFDDTYDIIEERGNNPVEEIGIASPYPEFNRLYGGFKPGDVYVFCARPKHGKALEENEIIPTPNGYTKIKDLKVGDEVFAVDGSVTKVVGTKRWQNRNVYKVIASDGSEVIADEEHEWDVKRRWDYKREILTTKQIANNPLSEKRGCELPRQGELQLPEKDLPIDPYILGIWLGDGTKGEPTITSIDDFIIKKWKKYGEKLGLSATRRGPIGYSLTHKKGVKNPLREKMKSLCIINHKNIPLDYLRGSIKQRKALLQGLIDSDGTVHSDGQIEFTSKDKELSHGVAELTISLGVKSRVYKRKSYLNGKRCLDRYRVSFYYKDGAALPRKRMKCRNAKRGVSRRIQAEYYGKANTVCIEIEHKSHLFLCGKGMLPTHNSSMLNYTGFNISNLGKNKIPCLILDTEMGQDDAVDVKFRLASSLTGIDPWYFSTGNWRKSEAMTKIVREEKVGGKTLKERMDGYDLHYRYLADATADKIVSTVKKWYYSCVGRGKPCVVVYDYIKMADDENKRDAEHQAVGKKINRLKELVTTEINAPLLAAVQLNRQGDAKSRDFTDSTSSISISDRILWFASYVGIFRKKTLDEIAEETDQFGTHKLITLESRFVGRDGGHNTGLVKKPDGKITSNFINFSVNNFKVKEICGAEEMYAALPNKQEIEKPEKKKKKGEYNPFNDS